MPQTKQNPDAQWTDECPRCHNCGCLTVSEVTLAANGGELYPETPLLPDGFDVDAEGKFASLHDLSTENELVRCDKCRETFQLYELAIE